MKMHFYVRWLGVSVALGLCVTLLGACCTSTRCLDAKSGPDRDRVQAGTLQLNVVHNDAINVPRRDRTDWKFIDLSATGKLTIQLHWDNGEAELELAVFDVLGVKIQDGRAWGAGGVRAAIVIDEPGRYYFRVRGAGKHDASNYSLRLNFRPDVAQVPCQACNVGEQKCLGEASYIICERVTKNCNAWVRTVSCRTGVPCRAGQCLGCPQTCPVGAQRCSAGDVTERCVAGGDGCQAWVVGEHCAAGTRCSAGECIRVGRTIRQPRQAPAAKQTVRARIISIYRLRGQMTLHLEIGDNPEVRPGQVGAVLAGTGNEALPGGEIRISKVSGRYAIATTTLDKLGKNRLVEIRLR